MKYFVKGAGYIFLIIGIILLFYNVYSSVKINSLISENNRVEGTIAMERLSEFDGAKYYVYNVEFQYNRLTYSIKTNFNSDKKRYTIGEKVDVFVDEEDPYNSLIDKDDEKRTTQIIGYSLSFIFILVGILLIKVKYEKLEPFFRNDA